MRIVLDQSFKGSEVENIIDMLYSGEQIDYIYCVEEGNYNTERKYTFLSLPLAIVPLIDSDEEATQSLEACIEAFLRSDGDNQYYVEKFDLKVDTIKG